MSRRNILIAFIALIAILSMAIFSNIEKSRQIARFRNLPVKQIDLSAISDGTYRGSFCLKRFCYRVDVIMSGGAISDIMLVSNSQSEYGEKAAKIKDRIIESQSLQIDMISGATITSKSIIKAVEKALTEPESPND